MWLQIIVFIVLIAVFLYWKFGKKISLPGLGGIGSKMGGFFGSLSPTSEGAKSRLGTLFLLGLVLLGVAIVAPQLYTWIGEIEWLTLFFILLFVGYIISGPKSNWFLKSVLFVLLGLLVWDGISEENAVKVWRNSPEPAQTQSVPKEAPKPKFVEHILELTAVQDDFTWVRIPGGATLHNFNCPLGTIMGVIHRDNPKERIYDCDNEKEEIALGDGILQLGFQSKDVKVIPVLIYLRVTNRS